MWVFAVIVIAIMVIVGIRRWGRVSDPIRGMASRNRRAWIMANTSDEVMDYDEWGDDIMKEDIGSDPAYCAIAGNAFYDACYNDEDPFYNSDDSVEDSFRDSFDYPYEDSF